MQAVCFYALAISEWDWSFSFGVNQVKWLRESYADHRHFRIIGHWQQPAKLRYATGDLIFVPGDAQNAGKLADDRPSAVGELFGDKATQRGGMTVPRDAVAPMLSALIAGRLKFLVLTGSPLRRFRASIIQYRFSSKLDEDEFPSG